MSSLVTVSTSPQTLSPILSASLGLRLWDGKTLQLCWCGGDLSPNSALSVHPQHLNLRASWLQAMAGSQGAGGQGTVQPSTPTMPSGTPRVKEA